jgi:zinc protease
MGVDEDAFSISLETLSEHKEEAFRMLGLALNEPRFDDSAIARVKTQTLSLIKDNASRPGYVLERAWAEAAFGKHPYAKPALGTSSSVEALSADDFRDVTRRYLTRANIIVAVAGDISAEEVKRLLDQQLARLPKNVDPDSTLTDVTLPGTATTQTVPFDVPQTMVRFGTQSIRRQDPDYMNAYVMNHILGGGGSLNTRLGREIREKRGFSYAVFSGLNPMTHGATWQGGFATRSEQVDEAVKTLTTTLKDFAEHGPSDVEFEDAKRYLTGSFVLGLDSNGDIAAFLVTMQRFQLGIDYLDRRNALVEAVTLEEVRRLAKKIVAPETLLIVMVGKERMPASSGAAAP